jgi:hypothetical protein
MQPADHPWHRALWFAIKYVDDENFWEEVAPYGVQRHTGPPAIEGPDVAGRTTLEGTLRWTRPDQRSAAFEERRRLTHVPLGEDAYAIDLDTTLTAVRAATIRSEPFTTWGGYGGLSLRGRSRLARHPPAPRRRVGARPGDRRGLPVVRPERSGR